MIYRIPIFLILFFSVTSLIGQNYWFGFITSTGDTINKKDSLGYWQGIHVQMNTWGCNKLNDTCEYQIGYYEDGQPIGEWTDYKKDGTFSIGSYKSGIEVITNSSGEMESRNQGIYEKMGIWSYYLADSTLIKVEKYEPYYNSKGWFKNTYLLVDDKMVLKKHDFNSNHLMSSRFKKTIKKTFRDAGSLDSYNIKSFWREISIGYYSNGNRMGYYKAKTIAGKRTGKTILINFDENGNRTKKVVGQI